MLKELIALACGISLGVGAMLVRDRMTGTDASACKTCAHPSTASCPAHRDVDDNIVLEDKAAANRLRVLLRDAVFKPWVQLGRAPTPDEIGAQAKLDRAGVMKLMDDFEACADDVGFGVKRVPESDLIAIAWPFSNVPTGIDVTVEGGQAVHARCAIDSLGVSQMLHKKTTVDAMLEDGVKLHATVDGDKLVDAEPKDAVVFRGAGCDQMLFFSSKDRVAVWKKAHGIADDVGAVFTLDEATHRGARGFGRFTEGLPD